jgi:hypothetical protein
MIGLLSPQTLAFSAAPHFASALTAADAAFARLGTDFFQGQGLAVEVSDSDRFLRAQVPLNLEEDPHGFLRTLGNVQGLLQDKARLIHISRNDGDIVAHLGFPYPSLLTGLLSFLYGSQAMTPVFLSCEVERDEINRMYARNEQPVGVFDRPMFLGDLGRLVHAFIFMYHDLYHLAFGSALALPLRQTWSTLYDQVSALPASAVRLPVAQRLLETLTDNDVDTRLAESEEMLAFIPFRAVMERLQEAGELDEAEDAFDVYRECENFLGALLSSLNPSDPKLLHADFMVRNLGEMRTVASTQASLRRALGGGFF